MSFFLVMFSYYNYCGTWIRFAIIIILQQLINQSIYNSAGQLAMPFLLLTIDWSGSNTCITERTISSRIASRYSKKACHVTSWNSNHVGCDWNNYRDVLKKLFSGTVLDSIVHDWSLSVCVH